MTSLPDLVWQHRDLLEEVKLHNLAVIQRRRRGGHWTAPENQYRNAITEIEARAALQAEQR